MIYIIGWVLLGFLAHLVSCLREIRYISLVEKNVCQHCKSLDKCCEKCYVKAFRDRLHRKLKQFLCMNLFLSILFGPVMFAYVICRAIGGRR